MTGLVKIVDYNLVFELEAKDSITALERKVVVPIRNITSVSTDTVLWVNYDETRIGGAGIPGLIKVGRYTSRDGRILYDMHNQDKCITVILTDKNIQRSFSRWKTKKIQLE